MMHRTAEIDKTGAYRYRLTRRWKPDKGTVLFVMLNPSTADANVDDPTITRCIGFASKWGYGGLEVANLFAFRATDPMELSRCSDPVGPDNDGHIVSMRDNHALIVAAWGANAKRFSERERDVLSLLGPVHCLGITKGGYPKHPLYVKGDAIPILYALMQG